MFSNVAGDTDTNCPLVNPDTGEWVYHNAANGDPDVNGSIWCDYEPPQPWWNVGQLTTTASVVDDAMEQLGLKDVDADKVQKWLDDRGYYSLGVQPYEGPRPLFTDLNKNGLFICPTTDSKSDDSSTKDDDTSSGNDGSNGGGPTGSGASLAELISAMGQLKENKPTQLKLSAEAGITAAQLIKDYRTFLQDKQDVTHSIIASGHVVSMPSAQKTKLNLLADMDRPDGVMAVTNKGIEYVDQLEGLVRKFAGNLLDAG